MTKYVKFNFDRRTMIFFLVSRLFSRNTYSHLVEHQRSPEHTQSDSYTGCNRRNGPDFGRVFLRSNYTDITQNTYIQS